MDTSKIEEKLLIANDENKYRNKNIFLPKSEPRFNIIQDDIKGLVIKDNKGNK